MSLIIEITQQNGLVVRQPVDPNSAKIAAQPGDKIRILNAETGQPAGDLVARRVGDALVVEQAGGATVELTEFFAPGEGAELVLEDGEKTTTISQATEPMSVAADGTPVMYDAAVAAQAGAAPAQQGAATAAGSGAAEGGAAAGAAAGTSTGAVLAGVGALGLAAAAGGGGGGGSSTPSENNPPAAPEIDPVAGGDGVDADEAAAGVTVTGTAEPGSTVTVVWSGAGGESYTQTAIAAEDGTWSVQFPMDEIPEDGSTTITAVAANAHGQSEPASVNVEVDTASPTGPVTIDPVAGDDMVNATEAGSDITLSGTAPAGSTVAIAWGSFAASVVADANGAWSVDVPAAEIPTADAAVTATAPEGSATRTVTIDTEAPDAPAVTEVGDAGVVNAAAVAGGVTVTGTAEPGSRVIVTWGALTAEATTAGDGTWTAQFSPGASDAETEVTAVAIDAAGNSSAPSAASAFTIDVTPPAAPTIDPIAGDGILVPGEVGAGGLDITGTVEEGSEVLVTLGDLTKPATVIGTTWTVNFAADEIPAGANQVTATATDAAGNPQTEPAASRTVVSATGDVVDGSGGADTLLGGTGDQIIFGGAGNDILVGDSGGSVRNYQFDYWSIDAGDFGGGGGEGIESWVGLNPGSTGTGWEVLGASTFAQGTADEDATLVNGGRVELRGNTLETGVEDPTGTGGTHLWDSVYDPDDPGSGVGQTIATKAGESYTLAIQAATVTEAAVEIWWDNNLIAYFNGTTGSVDPVDPDNWGGSISMVPVPVDGSDGFRMAYTFDVTATGDSTRLEIRTFHAADNDGFGFIVDRVTLTASAPEGNDTLVGGAGNDLIFGQGGNDTLVGGDGADTFVFSMRTGNGDDVIVDFNVAEGDRIMLIDAIDANTTGSVAPSADTSSDTNLTFADFMVPDIQQIVLSDDVGDGSGNLVLSFTGEGGASLGSVTLLGVNAADYESVGSLFDPATGILQATGDGFHANLGVV